MRRILAACLVCLALLGVVETWLRAALFRHASYANSESIDRLLRDRDTSDRWNLLFVGDSETHWGVDPAVVDATFAAAGMPTRAFDHAFDGFGASWWPALLPPLLAQPALRRIGVVVLGVQLIDVHRVIDGHERTCGALQKPVLTSPFAIDLGLDRLCREDAWDAALGRRIFGALWLVRYAPAVRSAVLPAFMSGSARIGLNSRVSGAARHGFEPHLSIAAEPASYAAEFARWKSQYDPRRDFRPLPPDAWPKSVAKDGYFDALLHVTAGLGRKLALFALPTNPALLDTFDRRADYLRNSALLRQWAVAHGVAYVDAGIRDVPDPDAYFSDMRHLSGEGAARYTSELAGALVAAFRANEGYVAALDGPAR